MVGPSRGHACEKGRVSMTARWINDPEARDLLALIVRNPPKQREEKTRYVTSVESRMVYTGGLVRDLRRVRQRYMELLFESCERYGDYTAFKEECGLTVDQAIEQALLKVSETILDQHLRIRRSKSETKVAA